ncbi:hypothetical protein [Streptomyces echinatus]|uniref:ABC-type amino acid transport system permease subunit n=2 Tax=Streptomyces echinatus TaxID=67293 RepID=A0A7W9Q351_9ACTN|nr:hypothetical protein [Streptomyces echinatus]MBB5932756.1 ABC-type amino acid transport system permease subunit [Streptomyces echinatus]
MHETIPALTDSSAGTPAIGKVPMWTTAATVALIPVAFTFGCLAGMATEIHPQTAAVLITCWWASWTVTPLLVLLSRLPLRHPTLASACRWAGWGAPVPPAVTILLTLGL